MALSLALPAGSLRHTIAIQAPSATHDAFGQPSQTWATVLTARASIEDVVTREMYQNGQFTGQVTHTIRLRWPGTAVSVASGMRIVCGAHTYTIQTAVNVGQRDRVLEIMALELNGGTQ